MKKFLVLALILMASTAFAVDNFFAPDGTTVTLLTVQQFHRGYDGVFYVCSYRHSSNM